MPQIVVTINIISINLINLQAEKVVIIKRNAAQSYRHAKGVFPVSDQASIIDEAYSDINKTVSLIISEFMLVS